MVLKSLSFSEKVTVFAVLAFCLTFLTLAFLFPEGFKGKLDIWTSVLLEKVGYYYLILGLLAVLILLLLAFSKWGKIRLGDTRAKYNWFSWISMLYSTGMGAGLLLRAVQEPTFYWLNPPRETSFSPDEFALQYTFFHWGLTPWAFYGLFGLLMAYVMYIKKESALSSSILPKAYQNSIVGVCMNVLTIICTLLGVVASLGLGGRQLLQAIGYMWKLDTQALDAIYLVILISILATGSALLGLSRGIRNLSNFNMAMASFLLFLVFIFGFNMGLKFQFFKILGQYLYEFIPMSLNLGVYEVSESFLKDWTYFYWAFWLAWAPFTGVFIARISQGRTVRDFILGVLIIPALGTFLWFTIFAQSAFGLLNAGIAEEQDFSSIYTGIFRFFTYFPMAQLTKTLAFFLVFTFLITSIDSAIYVLSMFSDAGQTAPSKRLRMIWGVLIGMFTIALIWIGKASLLEAISQVLVLFAFPFSLMFLGMVIYFVSLLFLKKKYS